MSERSEELTVQQFTEAARAFAGQVAAIPADRWAGPGLGLWDLRDLVGHTSRSLVTVETYLDQPAAAEEIASPEAYYLAVAAILRADTDAEAIVERGRAAGRALGNDPASSVEALVNRVLPLVERPDDPLLTTLVGGMRLSCYLPTRTFELVVHGLDIAAATGLEPPAYSTALLSALLGVASSAAVLQGQGLPLLRAVTGRSRLPEGFSVV